ncbi:mucin-5AC-like [Hippoglossus stenolepis]|uniref:mucin-5AC-like n=1 Tax=Hippoglossus stenolepis TaxID=195615 RepID=UPI00159C8D45|nr:mucin-5AC-like [Hippoglossus stenolepis]
MRLTALCVYGTLLALSSLSRTTGASGEGDLLGDRGLGPCAATLELEGPCGPGQEEDTCPYLFTLPPLTVHLPKQLRELEKIMKDLQKLKDNVDQLRKMCADCTVRQTERVCGTQREGEHVATNEGTDKQEDERKWANDRKDLREEFGTDVVKVEMMMEVDGDTDSEVRTVLEERGREKWKAEGERSEVVVKENEKTETLLEVALKDGKTQTEGGKVTDKLGQQKVPTSGGEARKVDMTRERNKETEKGTAKDKKGDLKGDQVDKLQSGKERKTTSDNKHKEKTEESDKHLGRDETKETDKKTQTEENRGSDGIKMSEDHDEHTNKEREQHLQDRKKKMERGLRVEQNNEKAKQTEIIGRAATQRTIKEGEEEGEDGEMGTEIKPEGEEMVGTLQRDSDEDLTSNRTSEGTDFVSVSQTPLAPISPTHDSVDSNKATTLTSSPPPRLLSSSRLIQDDNQAMTTAAHRITTQSTDGDVTSISEHPRPDAEADVRATSTPTTTTISTLGVPGQQITSSTTRFTSTTSPRPAAGFQDRSISTVAATTTSTPYQNLYTTTTTGVEDRSQWTVKKNASSNTGVKPRPKPGEKHKPGIKPEADRKLKNPKNDHKLDGAPSPDKKIKNIQKQKPSLQKPTAEQKPKPGKDPQRVIIKKTDQRAPLQHVKNNPGPKHDQDLTTDKNKLDAREPKSHLKSVPPVQRPTSHQRLVSINATGSDKDPLTERLNSKPEKKPNRPLKADKPESKQKPEKKPKSNEKAESDFTSKSNQHLTPESEKAETIKLKAAEPEQESVTELMRKSDENLSPESKSHRDSTPGQNISHDRISSDKKPKPSTKTPVIKQNPKPGRIPKPYQKRPELGKKIKPSVKPKLGQVPQTNQRPKKPVPGQLPDLKPESVPDEIPETESNKTSKLRPPTTPGPTLMPGATSVQRTKPAVRLKSSPKTKTDSDPHISGTTADGIQNSQIHVPPTSGAIKQTAEATRSPADTEFSHSTKKNITPGPMTSDSRAPGPSPLLHALLQGFTVSPDSRVTSDLRPQTAGQPSSIPMTTRPNKIIHRILPSVIASTSPGSTRPNPDSNADSSSQTTIRHHVEEMAPRQNPHPDKITTPVPSPRAHTTSTLSPDFRSTTPVTSGPESPAAELSTPSARELRVKINQVPVLPSIMRPKELPEDNQGGSRSDHKLPTWTSSKVRRDCSDQLLRGETRSGVYLVTPDIRSRSFSVLCDMELEGGGWTLLQRRLDGSVSFNRTWAEYRSGFGQLRGGEFWLGNTMIHLLTRERDMVLRVELEDFDGVREYAEYAQFRVASERLRYRLTVGGYSGTAGDALCFSKSYDHNQRPFTTPDRDNDRYPSGNCGAYYSSGWWFDACMAANLNGRYYVGKYRGVRDGIFWGTWANISTEYYPSSDRRSFKSVRMMIRPKGFTP